MNKSKKISIVLYLCAAVFYIAAVVCFVSDRSGCGGPLWLALGSVCICLGAVQSNKFKSDDKNDDK